MKIYKYEITLFPKKEYKHNFIENYSIICAGICKAHNKKEARTKIIDSYKSEYDLYTRRLLISEVINDILEIASWEKE
jgi:hypothetical protein